jgi:hypothetical protein
MRILRHALARCRALVRRDAVAGEIRDEMQFHVQMRIEEYERQGMPPDDARRAASRRFGNLALMQDRGYDVRGGGLMDTVLLDVRYGVRSLLKHRAFSTVAILTLAIGIGVSTALFSVIDAALLRPLPYPHPEELVGVTVRETYNGKSGRYDPSMADLRAWRGSERIFAHIGAGRVTGVVPRVVETGQAERLIVGEASEDFLEVYGVKPLLGTAIQIEDTREGAPVVALLGYTYWQSRFGGAPDVVGRVIRIAGVPATIVGVLPAGFYRETAVWQSKQTSVFGASLRGSGTPVEGRLRPGVTLVQAERELTDLTKRTASGAGGATDVRVEIRSMYDLETGGSGKTITPLAWGVSLILLIACVNVAGLLLARGAIREPELAIRASIGAGRGRLVRQLLTENLLLSFAAGVVGVGLAWSALDALVAIIPMSLPANAPATVNLTVLELPRRVIGVVGNVRHSGPLWAPMPEVYVLYGQAAPHPLRIVLRPRSSAVPSGDRLRQMAQAVGPKVLVGRIRSGADDLGERVLTPRRRTLLLGLLGGLGMALTLVGIFSMTAYAVARRTKEIGIRMALGAGPADVTRTIVRDAAWPALLGLSVGSAGAFYATRVIASFLFDTTPHDPATFATVAALMGGAALVAAWVPARRAARVDPVIALRAE